jgi:hypothetical protein
METMKKKDSRVDDRIGEYERDFEIDSLTTVDRAQIRRMAQLEIAADEAVDALSNTPDLTPTQRKSLGDTAKTLSAEARQLADVLGMSRSKRMSSEEAEQEQFIPQIYREAKEFIYAHAVAIICPHCRKEEAHVEIAAGTILYHFSFEGEWEWKSKCPRCGKSFKIDQNNYFDFLYSTLGQYEKEDKVESEDGDQEEI